MKCDFCGHEFDEKTNLKSCKGCLLNNNCGKVKCPVCNYEMVKPVEIRLFKSIIKRRCDHG